MGAYARDAGNLNRAYSWIHWGWGQRREALFVLAVFSGSRVATRSPRGAGSTSLAEEKT